ncbi:MAG: hypothetical protein ACRBG0_19205 [Lewinella sp.]|uniref:hypothetical protein n=1 Tax=Lewinella sp. TaxID=2004506 RepID=UPI003D6B7049
MAQVIRTEGVAPVLDWVMRFVSKCATQLNISASAEFIETLSEDIIDVYKYDSLEDIAECLKKGRQGRYGINYGKLNMVVIQEWMAKHLEEKYRAREAAHENSKHEESTMDVREEYIRLIDESADAKEVEANRSGIELLKRVDKVIKRKLK